MGARQDLGGEGEAPFCPEILKVCVNGAFRNLPGTV